MKIRSAAKPQPKPLSSTDPGCAGGYAEASFIDCTEGTCPQMPQIVADELSAQYQIGLGATLALALLTKTFGQ